MSEMIYRTLPHGGEQISVIGLGMGYIHENGQAEAEATVRMALDRGVNYLDLAAGDGSAYPAVARAIDGRREQVCVQMHFGAVYDGGAYGWTRDLKRMKNSFASQLRQLGTDYTDMGFGSVLLFVAIGTVLTMIVQASSATMAITLIMCANGWISFELGAALVLGENIGTTITANLAALTGNTQARRAALAHLVFNVFGVIWVLCLFPFFTGAVSWFVENVMGVTEMSVAVPFKLSAFHTAFNVCNVLVLIWFVKFIERTVCVLIPQREQDEEYRLRFITGGMLSTSELSILQASKEIHLYAERTHRMFGMVRDLLHTEKDDDFNKLFSRVEKYENISDSMELEIANYLNKVSEGRLSSESKLQIRAMLREVTEIESIGDSCYNLARTINRKRQSDEDFTPAQYEHIHTMMKLVDDALAQMIILVEHSEHPQGIDVNKSFNLENEINNYRNQLKNQNIISVNNKDYSYQMGVYYMDIIAECEKLGDYVVNVVEAGSDTKEKKAS